MPVLLTRPAADSATLAARLRARGVAVTVSPLLAIRFADTLPALAPAPALAFTSRNGVAAYAALGGPAGLTAWCVGPGTAAAAAAAGLAVRGTYTDAGALARGVPADAPPILHLRGAVQRGDLAADLRARGLAASDAVIYAQVALPLSAAALALLLAGPVLVPLWSPRSAALLAAACPPDVAANVTALALSAAVAAAWPAGAARVASRPDGTAMESLIFAALDGSAVEGGRRWH